MLTTFLHRLVAQPRVYDLVQLAVGMKFVRAIGAADLAYRSAKKVLDIGGGTGLGRQMWSPQTQYICLDIDPQKLAGYRAKNPAGFGLLADATNLPIADQTIDAVLCTAVTHHLTDEMLENMLSESAGQFEKDGQMILMDAVWAPRRIMGRILWHLDRGSFPRSAERLKQAMAKYFDLVQIEDIAVLHRYLLVLGKPQ